MGENEDIQQILGKVDKELLDSTLKKLKLRKKYRKSLISIGLDIFEKTLKDKEIRRLGLYIIAKDPDYINVCLLENACITSQCIYLKSIKNALNFQRPKFGSTLYQHEMQFSHLMREQAGVAVDPIKIFENLWKGPMKEIKIYEEIGSKVIEKLQSDPFQYFWLMKTKTATKYGEKEKSLFRLAEMAYSYVVTVTYLACLLKGLIITKQDFKNALTINPITIRNWQKDITLHGLLTTEEMTKLNSFLAGFGSRLPDPKFKYSEGKFIPITE